jgi:small-conductance mechanosensitive channel
MLWRTVLVAALGLVLAACGTTELTQEALNKEVESIGSAAAEGGLLAHDTADGRSTHAFTAVHSTFLAKQVRKVETKLSSADVPPDLEQDRAKADRLAARVESQLERLHDEPADRNVARSVASRLDDAAKQAEELAK